jgi:hypothetical protein
MSAEQTERFGRSGHDLTVTVPVTFGALILGAEIEVRSPEGASVTVQIPPGTTNGQTFRVPGKGLRRDDSTYGSLLVTVTVVFPQNLNATVRNEPALNKSALDSVQALTWYMASPESPSEQTRRLLQAIWDLSWSRWPTLAALCHSRTAYSRFQAGEAEALLAQIPAGFINGIGPDGRGKQGDSQELSLTVAGVAACRNTEKILTLFLRFIQHVVVAEKNWRPSSSDIYSQLFSNLRSGYPVSNAKFIWNDPTLPRLHSRKARVLQRLHLILVSEPGLWIHMSGYDHGDWKVTFDRRIRYFKGIRSLDDYWASRFKPWESSDPVPYPVVAASKTRDQASRPQLLCDHPDLLADVLLRRIFDCCGGLTSVVSCPRLDPDIDSPLIRQALRRLETQGRIRVPNVDTSTGLPDVILTSDGAGYISALGRYWADRMLRDGAARDALLAWLYDRGIHAKEPPDLYGIFRDDDVHDIFSDPRSFYRGRFFAASDIDDAASYLQDKNLIDGTRSGRKLSSPRITASGMDCIEQGVSVAEYAKQRHGDIVIGDKYEARGHAQIGAMGKGAKVNTVSFNSPTGEVSEVNLASLISELQSLRVEMRNQASTTEDDQAVVAVGQAISAAEQGDTSSLFTYLKSAGKWALNLATAIGAELAAAALKSVIGI